MNERLRKRIQILHKRKFVNGKKRERKRKKKNKYNRILFSSIQNIYINMCTCGFEDTNMWIINRFTHTLHGKVLELETEMRNENPQYQYKSRFIA